jgi:Ca2+-binding EF-hand superfamily protein
LKNFRNEDQLKEMLVSSYDFNYLDAFNTVDADNYGYIHYESIDGFMRSNGKVLSDDEIGAFIREVGNETFGKISYGNFVDALTPFFASTYSSMKKSE